MPVYLPSGFDPGPAAAAGVFGGLAEGALRGFQQGDAFATNALNRRLAWEQEEARKLAVAQAQEEAAAAAIPSQQGGYAQTPGRGQGSGTKGTTAASGGGSFLLDRLGQTARANQAAQQDVDAAAKGLRPVNAALNAYTEAAGQPSREIAAPDSGLSRFLIRNPLQQLGFEQDVVPDPEEAARIIQTDHRLEGHPEAQRALQTDYTNFFQHLAQQVGGEVQKEDQAEQVKVQAAETASNDRALRGVTLERILLEDPKAWKEFTAEDIGDIAYARIHQEKAAGGISVEGTSKANAKTAAGPGHARVGEDRARRVQEEETRKDQVDAAADALYRETKPELLAEIEALWQSAQEDEDEARRIPWDGGRGVQPQRALKQRAAMKREQAKALPQEYMDAAVETATASGASQTALGQRAAFGPKTTGAGGDAGVPITEDDATAVLMDIAAAGNNPITEDEARLRARVGMVDPKAVSALRRAALNPRGISAMDAFILGGIGGGQGAAPVGSTAKPEQVQSPSFTQVQGGYMDAEGVVYSEDEMQAAGLL